MSSQKHICYALFSHLELILKIPKMFLTSTSSYWTINIYCFIIDILISILLLSKFHLIFLLQVCFDETISLASSLLSKTT